MQVITYIYSFLIGIFFGSFYTLAVYRIPRKEDIIHTHSYCPNCNHKLGFFELIPIFSYIFLGGKCKHCKKKIRIRYLILELLSGMVFLLTAVALKLDISNIHSMITFMFIALFYSVVFIIAGIDKENRKIEKSVLFFGIALSIVYILYLYFAEKIDIIQYIIYLFILLILLIFDNITLRKFAKNSYVLGILTLVTILAIFTGEIATFNAITIALLAVTISILHIHLKNTKSKVKRKDVNITEKIPIAFFVIFSNVIIFIIITYLCNYF